MNRAVQNMSRIPYEWTPIIELQNNNDIIWLIRWQLKYNSRVPKEFDNCPLCK